MVAFFPFQKKKSQETNARVTPSASGQGGRPQRSDQDYSTLSPHRSWHLFKPSLAHTDIRDSTTTTNGAIKGRRATHISKMK